MSRQVKWRGMLIPRGMFDAALDGPLKPGQCVHCGGTGERAETIDDELPDAVVPCYWCQEFCKVCNQYRKKGGHVCHS